ncbi:MAG: hypothetical protein ACYCXT_13795 [Acidiferrobacteraceae bacterium]
MKRAREAGFKVNLRRRARWGEALGLLALMIHRQRIRRTHGIPTPDREKRVWAL